MAGRCAGLSDCAWRLWRDRLPPAPQQRRRGMPHAPLRAIVQEQGGNSPEEAQVYVEQMKAEKRYKRDVY